MPRSGTNFLERLLLTHPDTEGAPGGLRELPILGAAPAMEGVRAALARLYGPNADLFARHEWLAYAMGGYLNAVRAGADPATHTMLIKDPRVRNLWLFDAVTPEDTRAAIVLRDGRYLIDSTIRTWPLRPLGRTFEDVCLEWDAATRAALDYAAEAPGDRVRTIRYEDLVADAPATMAGICDWLGLDPARLDPAQLTDAPVLGSSTHSREGGRVGWTPVKKDGAFDPTGRALDWSVAQRATFARICGATQERAGYDT
jgi:hypothetical protein